MRIKLNKKEVYPIMLVLLASLSFSCEKDDGQTNPEEEQEDKEPTVFEPTYTRHDVEEDGRFQLHDENNLSYRLLEASGVASGRQNEGVVYLHEDSGNRNVVFVYDEQANHLGNIVLTNGSNRDWEDICVGPGPEEGQQYIYVADFGDNNSVREYVTIYRFKEPDLSTQEDEPFEILVEDVDHIEYVYPDGAKNAETLMIDPQSKSLIIVSKSGVNVPVYELPFPQNTDERTEAVFRGELPFRAMVGGDISPDGNEILIKDYGAVYFWEREEDKSLFKCLFEQTPAKVAYTPEVQGEAVGWSSDGEGYFTITEIEDHQDDPLLYYYRR